MNAQTVKFKSLFESLKSKILCGAYDFERPLPSVRALMNRTGLSSSTVRHALDELEHAGLVVRTRGRGTFVTKAAMSRKIGLFVPGVSYSEFFPPLVDEVSRLALENGYALCLGNVMAEDKSARMRQARETVSEFVAAGVSGVIYQPVEFCGDPVSLNGELVGILSKAGIAVVLLDRDIVPSPSRSGYDLVGINNFHAGELLARHLLEAGAKRVGYLAGKGRVPLGDRYEGVRSVLEKARRSVRALLLPDSGSAKGTLLAMARFRADAIVCANDGLAAEVMRLLAEKGTRVPHDIMLAGFDDVRLAALMSPPLTTIRQPIAAIAAAAFACLIGRMEGTASAPVEINLPVTLVVRDSTRRRAVSKRKNGARLKTSIMKGKGQ